MCTNNQPLEVIEYKGQNINIYQDTDGINPRKDYDNLFTFAIKNLKHCLGEEDEEFKDIGYWFCGMLEYYNLSKYDKDGYYTEQWENFICDLEAEDTAAIEKAIKLLSKKILIFEFHGKYTGYVYVEKERLLKEYSSKIVTKKIREIATSVADGEMEIFINWLEGEVYGYMIENEEGEENGGCWSFFGDNWDENGLLDHAKEEINWEHQNAKEKRQNKIKTFIKNHVPLWKREELLKTA